MKKAKQRLRHSELIYSFVKYGMLVVLCGGILFYQIIMFNKNQPSISGSTWVFWITGVEFLALIALAGVSLYKESLSRILWYEGILDSAGYIITLFNTRQMGELLDTDRTRGELVIRINALLKRMGTATERFKDYVGSIAGSSARQAEIINGLSEAIMGITSGLVETQDDLSEKLRSVKAKIHRHVENSGAQTKS